jgi:DNA-3-methyladenine glycosylase
MQMGTRLDRSFFARPALELAPALLGVRLVHRTENMRIAGIITEAEAYDGEQDLACHAKAGRTSRTEVMYRIPGTAYVYFT